MILQTIPETDLQVSRICLGTEKLGSTLNENDSFALLDAFTELGGNFLDTALIYADWCSEVKSASEKTIGKWLKERKLHQRTIVATKGACAKPERFLRLKREDILSDLHESLANLQTDCIDLYWLHRDDPSVPVEQIVDVLDEQIKAGNIRFIGCSNWTLARIQEARQYADASGKHRFIANQMMWSLAEPNTEHVTDKTLVLMDGGMRRFHKETGMAAIPFSSQASGFFSGRYANGQASQGRQSVANLYSNPRNVARLERVNETAQQLNATPSQVALAFMLAQPHAVFPIIGSRTLQQLEESCAADGIGLSEELARFLEYGQEEPAV